MVHVPRGPIGNSLLAALPPADLLLLEPLLERVSMEAGRTLEHSRQPIDHVYFPETAIASMVAFSGDGKQLEVGVIGPEGMTGLPVVLGSASSPHQIFCQVPGQAWRISAARLRGVSSERPSIQRRFMQYAHAFLVQVAQTALTNGTCSIKERLARWLLMCHDRIDRDELQLTHDVLSLTLGVRRAGVTVALHILEGAHAIRARRGRIKIVDRVKLELEAGPAYGPAEREYEKLMAGAADIGTGWVANGAVAARPQPALRQV